MYASHVAPGMLSTIDYIENRLRCNFRITCLLNLNLGNFLAFGDGCYPRFSFSSGHIAENYCLHLYDYIIHSQYYWFTFLNLLQLLSVLLRSVKLFTLTLHEHIILQLIFLSNIILYFPFFPFSTLFKFAAFPSEQQQSQGKTSGWQNTQLSLNCSVQSYSLSMTYRAGVCDHCMQICPSCTNTCHALERLPVVNPHECYLSELKITVLRII